MKTITPETCRAARALIGWSQEDLAREAQVGLTTVRNFESRATSQKTGEPIRLARANLVVMQLALEKAGVVFIDANGGGPGVRLRTDPDMAGNGEGNGPAQGNGRPGSRGGRRGAEALVAA